MPFGILATFAAYFLWGLFPFYFHALQGIGALEILAHRIIWSLVFITIVVVAMRRTAWLKGALMTPKVLGVFCLSALIIGANWGIYVYAIVSGRTIEASLGYFINPLVSIALGSLFLRERLGRPPPAARRQISKGAGRPRPQQAAVVLAGIGVLWITWTTGVAPWLGLMLAVPFGLYGLIRKIAPLGSLEGMVLESLLLTPAAAAWLWFLGSDHELAFISADLTTQILLIAAGPVTAVPLLFFASGVRRIPYSTSAVIQYVSPTMVFLIGVFAFGEPFSKGMLVGFLIIWAAVALFLGEMLLFARRCRNEAREAADRV